MIAPRRLLVLGLLATLGGCVDYGAQGYSSVPVANAPPIGPGTITSVDQFTNALAPFGQWLQSPQWGLVWQPQVGADWQPYTVGRWLDDPNYGRTWMGDEPWSWATDHYGRWGYDNQLGWLWVPGTQWAPAWVAWRDGSDTAGWAPLPPAIGYAAAIGFAYDNWGYDQWYAPSWVYVPRASLYAPYAHRPRAPYDRAQWNATRPLPPGQHGGYYRGGNVQGGGHGQPHGGYKPPHGSYGQQQGGPPYGGYGQQGGQPHGGYGQQQGSAPNAGNRPGNPDHTPGAGQPAVQPDPQYGGHGGNRPSRNPYNQNAAPQPPQGGGRPQGGAQGTRPAAPAMPSSPAVTAPAAAPAPAPQRTTPPPPPPQKAAVREHPAKEPE